MAGLALKYVWKEGSAKGRGRRGEGGRDWLPPRVGGLNEM